MAQERRVSPRDRAFDHYLRTGSQLPEERSNDDAPLELKFNPYHDPVNGRFTFAPGGPQARSNAIVSHSRSPAQSRSTEAAGRTTSLNRLHRQFLAAGRAYPAKSGTPANWTYRGRAGISKATFKGLYIAGHADAFRAAAREFDMPVSLVASVAYAELGNDSGNDMGYTLRAEGGRAVPEALGLIGPGRKIIQNLNRPRAETSFGPYNIQERRAAEILGYGDINRMSETARRTLIPTTRDSVAATFMLAKHLSDLRNVDFAGVPGKELTRDQMAIVATRYRFGPETDIKKIKENRRLGNSYIENVNSFRKIFQ